MTYSSQDSYKENDSASMRMAGKSLEFCLLISALLSWIGCAICFLLIQNHDVGGSPFCLSGSGCETILSSRYSSIGGVSLSSFGTIFYLTNLVLFVFVYAKGACHSSFILLEFAKWLTTAGVSFSASLMVIQFVLLRGFCPLCTASAVVTTGLFFLTRKCRRLIDGSSFTGSSAGAAALAGFALVSTGLLMTSSSVYKQRLHEALARPLQLDLATAQITGPQNAHVKLVVFSDFQCPNCARLAPVLKRIQEEFPNDVMIAYRYFPLEGHERAFPSAIAAECAAEQGAFWKYQDKLFSAGGDLSDERFLSIASSLGLDKESFRMCLNSQKARQVVETSYKDAVQNGLPGVPMLFMNGVMITGALDHDNLVKEITQKLRTIPHP